MSGKPSLFSRASAEIIDLHRFFVDWFVAARADAVEFGRFEGVMGEGLTMANKRTPNLDLKIDVGPMRFRRNLSKLIAAESQQLAAAE